MLWLYTIVRECPMACLACHLALRCHRDSVAFVLAAETNSGEMLHPERGAHPAIQLRLLRPRATAMGGLFRCDPRVRALPEGPCARASTPVLAARRIW